MSGNGSAGEQRVVQVASIVLTTVLIGRYELTSADATSLDCR